MILYNVTVIVEDIVHDEWIEWMKNKHVPDVMQTGIFNSFKICRVLDSPNEGNTYSFQYFCDSMEDINRYQREFAPALQSEHTERYKDRFVAFRTVMEVLD